MTKKALITGITGQDGSYLAELLLERERLAVVPGEAFGAPGKIRFSFACGMDIIEQALERLARFIASLS